MSAEVFCPSCARSHPTDGPVSRAARCDDCGADLRCCLACRFHDVSSYNECAEPSAERVVDKERANFCDYFSPAPSARTTAKGESSPAQSQLDALFKK